MSESTPSGRATIPGTDIPLDEVPPATDPLDGPAQDLDQLWEDFHGVVNMTSRELEEWLRTASAGEDAEAVPEAAGGDLGQHVVRLLGRRRVDVTEHDRQLMQQVVDAVRERLGGASEPTAGDAAWRHGLMVLGHDPLKPAR